jgi:uncharacterized protein (TIGR02611 family)
VRKAVRIVIGFLVLLVGLVLVIPGVPGPGLAVIVLGLIILSDHFQWARSALNWARQKADGLRDNIKHRMHRKDP